MRSFQNQNREWTTAMRAHTMEDSEFLVCSTQLDEFLKILELFIKVTHQSDLQHESTF